MTPTPQLKRPAFHIWLAPDGVDQDTANADEFEYHHVVVRNGDQLRAELEASRLKLDPRRHSFHLTNLWLWAACVRAGLFAGTFHDFKDALVSYDPDEQRAAPHTTDPETTDELDARPTEASTS